MKKTKINHFIEYLSLTLILSYFFVHNIYLVLIGITFSLYLINNNYLNSIISSINKNSVIKKSNIDSNSNDLITKYNSIYIESIKEGTKLTLVETIEELGFIPSIDKDEKRNAA